MYWIAFRGGRWKNVFLVMIIAPFFVTYLIRTLAWQNILADQSVVVDTLKTIGVLDEDGRLLATSTAVVAGITYNFLPFMALPIYVALEQIDGRLIEAATDLYASRVQAFLRVTLPLSLPGVVAGTLLTFIPAAGDFINAQLLGTPQQQMIGNVIQTSVPRADRLPVRGGAVVRADGVDPRRRARVREGRRDGEADRMTTEAARLEIPARRRGGVLAAVRHHALTVYAALAFVYLLLPIAVVIMFSFNDPAGRFNYVWQGFTLDNWRNWNAVPGLSDAMWLSLAGRVHRHAAGHRPRDADRARARPPQVPRARHDEPPDLPADVDARDRARRVAADALPQRRASPRATRRSCSRT